MGRLSVLSRRAREFLGWLLCATWRAQVAGRSAPPVTRRFSQSAASGSERAVQKSRSPSDGMACPFCCYR